MVVVGNVLAAMALDGAFGRNPVSALVAAVSASSLGWIIIATGKSFATPFSFARSALVWLACVGVAVSGGLSLRFRMGNLPVPAPLVAALVVSWLLLGVAVTVVNRGSRPEIDADAIPVGMVFSVAMIFSEVFLSPWERKSCITEGPAQVLACVAWYAFLKTP